MRDKDRSSSKKKKKKKKRRRRRKQEEQQKLLFEQQAKQADEEEYVLEIQVVRARGLNENKDCWVKLTCGSDIKTTKTSRVSDGKAKFFENFEFILGAKSSKRIVDVDVGYSDSRHPFGWLSISAQDAENLDPKWFPLGAPPSVILENVHHGELFLAVSLGVKIQKRLSTIEVEALEFELVAPMELLGGQSEVSQLLKCDAKYAWETSSLCSLLPLQDLVDIPLSCNSLAMNLGVDIDVQRPLHFPHTVQKVYAHLMQRLNDVHFGTGFEPGEMDFESEDRYFAWRDAEEFVIRDLIRRVALLSDFAGASLEIYLIGTDRFPLRKWLGTKGKGNPYCKVIHFWVAQDGLKQRVKYKSRVLKNTCTPCWKERIVIPLRSLVTDEIVVQLWDKGLTSVHVCSGVMDLRKYSDGLVHRVDLSLGPEKTFQISPITVIMEVRIRLPLELTIQIEKGPSEIDHRRVVDVLLKIFIQNSTAEGAPGKRRRFFGELGRGEWALLNEYADRYGVGRLGVHLQYMFLLISCLSLTDINFVFLSQELEDLCDALSVGESLMTREQTEMMKKIASVLEDRARAALRDLGTYREQLRGIIALLTWALARSDRPPADSDDADVDAVVKRAIEESYTKIEKMTQVGATGDDSHDSESILLFCQCLADEARANSQAFSDISRTDLSLFLLSTYYSHWLSKFLDFGKRWKIEDDPEAEFGSATCCAISGFLDTLKSSRVPTPNVEKLGEACSRIVCHYIETIVAKRTREWVLDAVHFESWECGEDNQYSESVSDIFSMLSAAIDGVKALRFLDEQSVASLSEMACVSVDTYSLSLKDDALALIEKFADENPANWLGKEICVRLNNLQAVRNLLDELVSTFSLLFISYTPLTETPPKVEERFIKTTILCNDCLSLLSRKCACQFEIGVLRLEMKKLLSQYPEDVEVRIATMVENVSEEIIKISPDLLQEPVAKKVMRDCWEATVGILERTLLPEWEMADVAEFADERQSKAICDAWRDKGLRSIFELLSEGSLKKRLQRLAAISEIAVLDVELIRAAFVDLIGSGLDASDSPPTGNSGSNSQKTIDVFRLLCSRLPELERKTLCDEHRKSIASLRIRLTLRIKNEEEMIASWPCFDEDLIPGRLVLTSRHLIFFATQLQSDRPPIVDVGSLLSLSKRSTDAGDVEGGGVILNIIPPGLAPVDLSPAHNVSKDHILFNGLSNRYGIIVSIMEAGSSVGNVKISVLNEDDQFLHNVQINILGARLRWGEPASASASASAPPPPPVSMAVAPALNSGFVIIHLADTFYRTNFVRKSPAPVRGNQPIELTWDQKFIFAVFASRTNIVCMVFDGDIQQARFWGKGEQKLRNISSLKGRRELILNLVGPSGGDAGTLSIAVELDPGKEPSKCAGRLGGPELTDVRKLMGRAETEITQRPDQGLVSRKFASLLQALPFKSSDAWMVRLHLLRCTELSSGDNSATSVIIEIANAKRGTSKTISGTANPKFDEMFEFDFRSDVPPGEMRLTVTNSGFMFGLFGSPIGSAVVELRSIAGMSAKILTVNLISAGGDGAGGGKKKARSKTNIVGTITFKIQVLPPARDNP